MYNFFNPRLHEMNTTKNPKKLYSNMWGNPEYFYAIIKKFNSAQQAFSSELNSQFFTEFMEKLAKLYNALQEFLESNERKETFTQEELAYFFFLISESEKYFFNLVQIMQEELSTPLSYYLLSGFFLSLGAGVFVGLMISALLFSLPLLPLSAPILIGAAVIVGCIGAMVMNHIYFHYKYYVPRSIIDDGLQTIVNNLWKVRGDALSFLREQRCTISEEKTSEGNRVSITYPTSERESSDIEARETQSDEEVYTHRRFAG